MLADAAVFLVLGEVIPINCMAQNGRCGQGPLPDWDRLPPGRARRKPLKPLRAGMPGDSGGLVVTRVRSTTTIAHETAGASGIRHSPRPPWAGD
jgi:hypothetical protein